MRVTVGVGVATALLASSCLAAMARAVAGGMSSSSTTEEPVRENLAAGLSGASTEAPARQKVAVPWDPGAMAASVWG